MVALNTYVFAILRRRMLGARAQQRNGGPTMRAGDRVRIVVPQNERLHGTLATIEEVADWGAHLRAPAAATGRFRALWTEMEPAGVSQPSLVPQLEYSGDFCARCGSSRLRRAGACMVCEDCGESGGCG